MANAGPVLSTATPGSLGGRCRRFLIGFCSTVSGYVRLPVATLNYRF